MSVPKLHYFELAGRAESARIIFTVGGIAFEDVRYAFADPAAGEAKAKGPYGQLPMLELADGKVIAQSSAIERYAAKLGNLLPVGDDISVAQAESIMPFMEDIWQMFIPSMALKGEEQLAARAELLSGKAKTKLLVLSALMDKFENGFACGGKLSYVDLVVFSWLGFLFGGFLSGCEPVALDAYPSIQKFRHTIASFPAVKAYYESSTAAYKANYQPDCVAAFASLKV